jgi:predicted DsbA family dithiol-disulfide isomerase
MAYQKKEKSPREASRGSNALQSPDERQKFKSSLAIITKYLQQVDDIKEGMTETIADISAEYGLDKKVIRKLATTMYNHSYNTLLEENNHFSQLYEQVVEGRLRDDGDEAPDEE